MGMQNTIGWTRQQQQNKSRRQYQGPFIAVSDGVLVVSEGDRQGVVVPQVNGDYIYIGCTTLTREAFDRIVEVVTKVTIDKSASIA